MFTHYNSLIQIKWIPTADFFQYVYVNKIRM